MATLASIDRWDIEADVVILGFGLAGAVAAIEAHDTDPEADILIIEKNPEHKVGGNSRVAGQALSLPRDRESLLVYQRALNEPNPVPEELLAVWADAMIEQQSWIERMANEVGMALEASPRGPEFADMPGSQTMGDGYTIVPRPSGVWNCFKAHVDRRTIRSLFDTRAVDLIQDPDSREVFGVLATRHAQQLAIRARRALVMCVGGFEGDLEMNLNYCGQELYPLGNPANTGDGIRMLQRAGAELWHMRNRNQSSGIWPAMKFPEYAAAFFRNPWMTSTSWIEIARDNRRFYDEGASLEPLHYRIKVHDQWVDAPHASVLPVHMIFDEQTRLGDCLSVDNMSWNILVEGYRWSPDNTAEIERGWITRANTIHQLATKIGRDPDALHATIERYNHHARSGHDPDYGRAAERMTPIEHPPFYAAQIVPGLVCSTGGAKRDTRSRVLDTNGHPIPRLYEAGELGSTIANLYQNGSFLTECMVFGRIAGRHAVTESSLTPPRHPQPDAQGIHQPAIRSTAQ